MQNFNNRNQNNGHNFNDRNQNYTNSFGNYENNYDTKGQNYNNGYNNRHIVAHAGEAPSRQANNANREFVDIISLGFALAEKVVQKTVLFANLHIQKFVKTFVNMATILS